ncbi:MAG TPA: GAF domain-containing sensor histidine kinase [Chloroflexia bacterium]|nr:GAF domain-containing sensor histidine kinase [Chloroflexia bacterium]
MSIPDNNSSKAPNNRTPQTNPILSERRAAYTAPLRPLNDTSNLYMASRNELLAEVERQARELRLLHEMRTALLGVNDLDSIFRTAVESIASIFEFSWVTVYRLIDNFLQIQAQVGYEQYYETIPLGRGVQGRVAESGRGALITDVRKDPDYLEAYHLVTSQICVPLVGPGHEVLGVLCIEADKSRVLDERDYKLCQAMAEHVTLAVSQALGYEREKRRLTQLAVLNHVGRDLASALDVKHIIQRVTGPVRDRLNLYSVNIGLVENNELTLWLSPSSEGEVREYRWPMDFNSLICHSARTGELVVCHDVSAEPRYHFLPEIPLTRSEVIMPLRSGGEIIGVLDVESDGSVVFDDDDIIMLKTLADQTSVALTNALRFERLQRQSEELNATNQALEEANRLKSEFLANVSHELRTPLNSIIGYVDMIQTGFFGDVPDEMNDPLERVYRNGRRLMSLINDVLDLANIEAGRLQLLQEEVLTVELMPLLASPAQVASQEKGLDFRSEIMPGAPRMVKVDIKRLQQVVGILISNAVKFTHQGEIRLLISPTSGNLPGDAGGICIVVEDTGIGIAESEFEHIFEEFRQVDGSSTRQFGGTGLGLALARRLVRQMGGKLEVSSKLNVGSAFTIMLPGRVVAVSPDIASV